MDFNHYTTTCEACKRSGMFTSPDDFYNTAIGDAVKMRSGQFYGQLLNERAWEEAHKPYYNVWPSVIPMLTRLSLDLDSGLIQLPLPALCIRFPKEHNPLTFEWKGGESEILCMLMGDMNQGRGISILIDVGEGMTDGKDFRMPVYTYRNFRKEKGLTVEQSLSDLRANALAELGVQIPKEMITDCVRLCCTLCLLEHDRSVIEPDILSKDRIKYEQSGDNRYVEKAHRRGKVGWNVGRSIEVVPHYRRPHMTLVWTGPGRSVPRVVPRRGSVVHREVVEKLPSGYGDRK